MFEDDNGTPEDRAFLEDSIFYGFDYVQQLPREQVPTSQQDMVTLFLGICRNSDRMVSR